MADKNRETSIRSRRLATALLILGALLWWSGPSYPAAAADPPVAIPVIEVTGLIDPIQADFIADALDRAVAAGAEVLVLRLDSAGGVVDDEVIERLVARVADAPIPVAAWVGPSRASRALGQAYRLLEATDVAGMAPGTRVGPTAGAALTAAEAEDRGVVALTAPTLGDFIVELDGREAAGAVIDVPTRVVERDGGLRQRELGPAAQVRFAEPSLTAQLLHAVATPSAAYLLLVVALLLFVFEFFTAGVGVAAGAGVASLVLGAYGLGVLPTRPLGLALIGVAVLGYAIDVQAGTPRAWTVIGTVAFVAGSVTLYDGLRVPLVVLGLVAAGVALFMVSAMPAVVRTRFSTATIGRESLIGELGEAVTAVDPDGLVRVREATWRARTNRATPLAAGARLRVAAIDGLVLEVEPEEGGAQDYRERARRGRSR